MQGVDDFKAQELASTAWTFAKAGQSDALAFVEYASVAERRVAEFT